MVTVMLWPAVPFTEKRLRSPRITRPPAVPEVEPVAKKIGLGEGIGSAAITAASAAKPTAKAHASTTLILRRPRSGTNNLILRRPRSGRLEGWATDAVRVPILRDAACGRSSG